MRYLGCVKWDGVTLYKQPTNRVIRRIVSYICSLPLESVPEILYTTINEFLSALSLLETILLVKLV
jgi:hypothetical protein